MGHSDERLVDFPDLGWRQVEIGPWLPSYHLALACENEGMMAAGQRITAACEHKTKLIDEDVVRKDEREQSRRAEKYEVGRNCIQIVISFTSHVKRYY
jgi:hypothetical protein